MTHDIPLGTETQQKDAATRLLLRAGQHRRWAAQ